MNYQTFYSTEELITVLYSNIMHNEKNNLKLNTHAKSKFRINPQTINLWLKKKGSNSIEKGNGDIVMMGCMVMFG